jgi:uncharacterized protein YdaU (DUF1376 family)
MRWLAPEQRGYLFALLCEAWLSEPRGHIPINRGMIWKLAGAESQEKFEAASAPVLEMFEKVGDFYCYRKLADQDKEIRQVSQSRSNAGKNGAKSRWQGDGKEIASAIGNNGKSMASVIAHLVSCDGKSIADLDPDSERDLEEMRKQMREESAREEIAPGGASTSWPHLEDDNDDEIPCGRD